MYIYTAQCIVIVPVCVFVSLYVTLLQPARSVCVASERFFIFNVLHRKQYQCARDFSLYSLLSVLVPALNIIHYHIMLAQPKSGGNRHNKTCIR